MKDLNRIITLDECKEYFEEEFYYLAAPLVLGARKKYPNHNWLKPNGRTMAHKTNYASIFRHVAEGSVGEEFVHDAPNLTPRQCAACRLMMADLRSKRGIIHPEDL